MTCVGPQTLPAWDFGEFGLAGWLSGGCGNSVSDSSCHLCRGLPGGGTAETDASQSMDNKPGRQGGGRRARLGVRGSWAGLASLLLPPCCSSCCCQAQEPLQSATGRDKRERKRDVKAHEELEGKLSSLPACTEPALGLKGVRLKSRGSSRIRPATPSATDGKRVRVLSNGPVLRTRSLWN